MSGSSSTVRYGYDVGNKRVWRGDGSGLDENAFWAGQKMATYQVSSGGSGVYFTLTSTNVYFGGKLISKGSYSTSWTDKVALAPVVADRLGSIKKFYPYGTERPSATGNDTEKFTGYFRDASTGLDYADQRYEQPGVGRFMSPDPYAGSAKASNPGSWNRYTYAGGDPVNRKDPSGLYISGYDSGYDEPGYFYPEYFETWDPYFLFIEGSYPYLTYSYDQGGGDAQQAASRGRGSGADDYVAAVIKMLAAADTIKGGFTKPDCNRDLEAVGVTRDQVLEAVGTANFLNGWTNQANYADSVWGHSQAWSANKEKYGGESIRDYFSENLGTEAVGQAFGHDIYVDPTWVNSFSSTQSAALLLHELLHNLTGQVDWALQDMLGLPHENSHNIGNKLETDCFK